MAVSMGQVGQCWLGHYAVRVVKAGQRVEVAP